MKTLLPKLACAAALALLPAASASAAELVDGPLTVSAELPDEVRVGDEFEYDIVLTNTSDTITLHDVTISQKAGEKVSVDSANVLRNNGNKAQQKQQNKNRNAQNRNATASNGGETITVDRLDPGQSKTVSVTAAADKQGSGQVCLMIEGYTQALCLSLSATKPELNLTKTAPDQINLCEPFQYEYTLTNDGTGDINQLTVSDKLSEGVIAIDGSDSLEFQVDGLGAGDSRTFKANVVATRTGEFSTRAMAKAGEDLQSRSDSPSTKVVAPRLAVELEGPSEVYLDTPAQYTLRVSNTGDAPAIDTRVDLAFPNAAGFAKMSDLRTSDTKVKAAGAKSKDSVAVVQPTFATKGQNQSQQANMGSDVLPMDDEEGLNFGDIAAGETKEIALSMTPQEPGVYGQKAEVSYYCAAAEEVEMRTRLSAVVFNKTEVIALPALLLAVYDNEEENRGDGKISYRIVVKNQGEAKDTNLQLTAEMPEGLKFESGDGPTDVSANGSTLEFGKVNTIRPGQVLEWDIATTVQKGAGDVRFEVEMNADSLTKPATAEEPTRLLDIAAENN